MSWRISVSFSTYLGHNVILSNRINCNNDIPRTRVSNLFYLSRHVPIIYLGLILISYIIHMPNRTFFTHSRDTCNCKPLLLPPAQPCKLPGIQYSDVTSQRQLAPGAQVTVTCNRGYRISSSSVVECVTDDTFKSSLPSCIGE